MKNLQKILLIIAAVIAGEFVMVLLITLVQEVIFGGISWSSSSLSELTLGGAGTFLAAVAGGLVAQWINRSSKFYPHAILTFLILLETTWLMTTRKTPDPLWFDLLAASSLVVGIWLGGWLLFSRQKIRWAAN